MWKSIWNFKIVQYYPLTKDQTIVEKFLVILLHLFIFIVMSFLIIEAFTCVITPYPQGIITAKLCHYFFLLVLSMKFWIFYSNNWLIRFLLIIFFLVIISLFLYFIYYCIQRYTFGEFVALYFYGIFVVLALWNCALLLLNLPHAIYLASHIKAWYISVWYTNKFKVWKLIWTLIDGPKEEKKTYRPYTHIAKEMSILRVIWGYHVDRREYPLRKWFYALIKKPYNLKWENDLKTDMRNMGKGMLEIMDFLPDFVERKAEWLNTHHRIYKKNKIRTIWCWLKSQRKKK